MVVAEIASKGQVTATFDGYLDDRRLTSVPATHALGFGLVFFFYLYPPALIRGLRIQIVYKTVTVNKMIRNKITHRITRKAVDVEIGLEVVLINQYSNIQNGIDRLAGGKGKILSNFTTTPIQQMFLYDAKIKLTMYQNLILRIRPQVGGMEDKRDLLAGHLQTVMNCWQTYPFPCYQILKIKVR